MNKEKQLKFSSLPLLSGCETYCYDRMLKGLGVEVFILAMH